MKILIANQWQRKEPTHQAVGLGLTLHVHWAEVVQIQLILPYFYLLKELHYYIEVYL